MRGKGRNRFHKTSPHRKVARRYFGSRSGKERHRGRQTWPALGESSEWRLLLADVREYQFLFAGVILLASVLAVGNYFFTERIPLSIASSEVISALPVVFAWMVWMVVILLWTLGCPVVVLLTCERVTGLVSAIHLPVPKKTPLGPLFGFLTVGWVVASCICFGFVVAFSDDEANMITVLILSVIVLWLSGWLAVGQGVQRGAKASGVWHMASRLEKKGVGKFLDDLALRSLAVAALQTLFIICVYVFLYRRGWSNLEVLGIIIIMAFLQCLIGTVLLKMRQMGRQLTAAFLISLFAVVWASVDPALANFFVSNVLARQAMGGGDCVVLKWSPEAKVLPELVNDQLIHGVPDKTTSKPVRILFASSSTAYVRPKDESDRMKWEGGRPSLPYSVPQGAIAGYVSCPSKR